MPTCIINQCYSKTGKKGQSTDIIMHPFPNNLTRIHRWLFHTGQQFSDVDLLANRIKAENKTSKYRLCSLHFSADSYIGNATSRTLRKDAVPTIFPPVKEGEVLIEESLKKGYKGKRKRKVEVSVQVTLPPLKLEDDSSLMLSSFLAAQNLGPMFNPDSSAMPNSVPAVQHSAPTFQPAHAASLTDETYSNERDLKFCEMSTQTDFTLPNSFVSYYNTTSPAVDSPALGIQYSHTEDPNTTEIELPQNKRLNLNIVKIEETESDPRDYLMDVGPCLPKAEPGTDIDYGNITTNPLPTEIENKLSILEKSEIKVETREVKVERTDEDDDHVGPTLEESEILASFHEETKQEPSPLDIRPTEEQQEQNRKLIIFESSLDQLLLKVKCLNSTGCESLVQSFEKNFVGRYCKIKGRCLEGHSFTIDLLLETFH